MAVQIETFRPEHQAAFDALNRHWLVGYGLLEPHDEEQLRDPVGQIIAPGGQVFVATLRGYAVGTCAAIRINAETFELAKLAVDPAVRRRGIGHRLVTTCLAFARDRGATRVVLVSNAKLKDAIRLYELYDFRHRPVPADVAYVTADVYMERAIGPDDAGPV